MPALSHLFSPITIGAMTAKNRLLMSAMSINFGVDADGFVTDQLTAFFEARARGRVGMMLVGGGGVHPTGVELPDLPKLWEDGCIPALRRMVSAMRPYDVRFGVQLMHGGRQSYHDHKVAPSAIPAPAVVKGVPRELAEPEIRELIGAFGDAARRCREAGFDFIEIHGAHGYLINQFLSPNANARTDGYGGGFDGRIRFFLELLRDVKAKTGDDYPVGLRINGNDYIENGWTLDEAVRLAPILEREGADYLHVSAGVYGSSQLTIPSMYVDHGCFIHLAEAVKSAVSIPVIGVGRIKDPVMADGLIRDGRVDVVAMGRALLADPELPAKAMAGQAGRIRPCLGCCLGCIHAVLSLEPGGCVVNPEVGREHLLEPLSGGGRKRRVLVAGAGPAGMATARTAAMAGCRVTVCEAGPAVGGALRSAARAPGRAEVGEIIDFLERELSRLGVDMRLETPLSDGLITRLDPDVLVLATGSLPEIPVITGLSQTRMVLATVLDILNGKVIHGPRVLVLGGGQAGLLVADYLADQGSEVTVLNRRRHFAEEMSSNDRFYLRERLKRGNIRLYKQVVVKSITGGGAVVKVAGDILELSGFDTFVIAEKMASMRDARSLRAVAGREVHLVGDARSPRQLMVALAEAEELARSL
jgi:2,4-dienoyl-CoA reductase-like NADH-dependent reductase (Old Yellow Enzyme family)